jgi:hypothetical protein
MEKGTETWDEMPEGVPVYDDATPIPRWLLTSGRLLSGPELRALTYILLRTWGEKRGAAALSYTDFLQDSGIGNRNTVSRALAGLERDGFIAIVRREGHNNVYRPLVGDEPTAAQRRGRRLAGGY